MAELFDLYDPNEVETRSSGDFSPLPTGDYVMQMISSDWKDTKSGSGRYIKFEFEVLDGEYAGCRYWEHVNLINNNDTAVKIAKETLKEVAAAVGIHGALRDTQELHFKPLVGKIRCKPRKDDPTQMENTARFAPLDGAAPSAAPRVAVSATAAPRAAAPAAAPKPWERHKRSA